MNKVRILSILNFLALILHIFFSYGSQIGWVGRKSNREVSDSFPTLFTPAGFTFAIWGLIYFGLLLFCIYHVINAFNKVRNEKAAEEVNRIGFLFIISQLATVAWLFAFGNEQLLYSMLLLFVQLVLLIAMHVKLGIFNWNTRRNSIGFTQIPLSIYLGWISIASIANTAIYLHSIQWDRLGLTETVWTIIMITVAVLIGQLMIIFRRNIFFAIVVCWALFGLLSKRKSEPHPHNELIIPVAYGAIGILLLTLLIWSVLKAREKNKR